MRTVDLAGRSLGPGHPCFVIAEVGMAHDGSLGTAHAYIDAVSQSGADAVKFQTHIAEAESTAAEPFRVPFSRQDPTRYEYWRRTAFTADQWIGLADHARELGLIFLSSPFSDPAVELLLRAGVPGWKVASGEVSNLPLLARLAASGRPVLLSSGMSSVDELDRAVATIRAGGADVAVLQCTSEYPCPPEHLGLGMMAELAVRYGCPVGLSDHSGTIFAGLGAVALGANLLEVHVTLSRHQFGPDVVVSLTPAELTQLVTGTRFLERALGSGFDKNAMATSLAGMRMLFTKSVVAASALPAGTLLTFEHLALKKPGGGIPPSGLIQLVGRRLSRQLHPDEPLRPGDVIPEWQGVGEGFRTS